MLKIFFRISFFLLGLWLTFHFSQEIIKPIQYKISGGQAIGRVEGFVAGRNGSMQPESSGIRNGTRIARRPVFRYAINATDSVSSRNGSGVLFNLFQYELNEKVRVVFPKSDPKDGYIFSFMTIFVSFLLMLFGVFTMYLGFARSF